MSTLTLKAWREAVAHKGQFVALVILVALGVMSFVTFQNGYLDLDASLKRAYALMRFSDFIVSVEHVPMSVSRHLATLPGVEEARVRTVQEVTLEYGSDRQAIARVISFDERQKSALHSVYLLEGRLPRSNRANEILLHPKFASDTNTGVGDTVVLRMRGKAVRVRIVGIATDPEYLYPLRGQSDLPANGEFTPVYVPERTVERLFGTHNTGNSVLVRVSKGAPLGIVAQRIEDELEVYGVSSTAMPDDQPGYASLKSELTQNRIMAQWLPLLVLVISALSLFIALSRLVAAQRGEIGLSKALGYTDAQILLHYLSFAMIVAVGGSILGVLLGLMGARGIAASYVSILGLPMLARGIYPWVLFVACGMAFVACALAAIMPALGSARIAPALAMHADPNVSISGGRISIIERLLNPVLPKNFTVRIPLRNLFRSRRRSVYTIAGIALAMILSVSTVAMFDSIDYLLNHVFTNTERWDIAVAFTAPVTNSHIEKVRHVDGVNSVQTALVLPAEISNGNTKRNVVLNAMSPTADFHGFSGATGASAPAALKAGEIVIARSVAKALGVSLGSFVRIDSVLWDKPKAIRVGTISDEVLGQPTYVSMDTIRRLAESSSVSYNMLYLSADAQKAQRIRDKIVDMPDVATVQVKATLMESLDKLLEMFNVFGYVLFAFGASLAFVVVFTTFTANVTERAREIATMRTIGEDNVRLSVMITIENLLLAIPALPLGVWLGLWAMGAIFEKFEGEAYTLAVYIYPESVEWMCGLMIVVMLLSEIPALLRVFHLDLAEATKFME